MLRVQVCYAEPAAQHLRDLDMPAGATVRDAILQSGISELIAERDVEACKVGIYGKIKTLDTALRDRDRVEIYRPLLADPKEARRRRVEKKKAGKG